MNPKHIEEITDPQRIAKAPYNFVELPEKVVEAELPFPDGDRYHPNKDVELPRHTGRIECTLTTKSKLYTRSGWSPEDFAKYEDTAFKDLPDDIKQKRANFFINTATQQPIIPGSSIRGMLRTLVELITFSKIDRVTDNKLFYRSLGDPALRDIYQANFVENIRQVKVPPHPHADCYHSKVHAGFLRKHKNSYVIEECGYGRIDRDFTNRVIPKLPNPSNLPTIPLYQGSRPGQTPSWTYQHQTIYVEMDEHEQNYFFPRQVNKNGKERHPNLYLRFRQVHCASFTPAPGLQKGTLVITGDMQHKHLEFVFLDEKLNEYSVSEEMVRRFQDDDQITKWQKDAYSRDKPSRGCRQQDGYLRDGEPVFFLLNDDGETVRFFGRAQMFRLPYEHSPLDFVPSQLRDTSRTDIAEAIFGYVNGKEPREKARAGRVFISDATLNPNQEEKVKSSFNKNPVPILLSSPKPTTFQHYLVQQDVTQGNLKHYASNPPTDNEPEETVIRGHKLYWHKPCVKIEVPENADTQTSLIKPIEPELQFTFNIYFENLNRVELGALLWVLSLSSDKAQKLGIGKKDDQTGKDEQYCLSLGMGKPLGMGAVKIEPTLYLSDRSSRYSNLFKGDTWATGEENQSQTAKEESESVKAFEKYVLDWICCQDYPKDKSREQLQHLKELPRIEMLLAMLRCDKTPDSDKTRYMEIGCDPSQKQCIGKPKKDGKVNEYAERPVLPTPLDVMSLPDKRRLANSAPYPSTGRIESSSSNSPKPILKGQDKGKPIKKSQQPQQQKKPRDNSGESDSAAWARPPKPKN